MSGPPRTTRVKILQPQTRVSGAVGDFIEDGSKRRKRRRLYGVVLQATSRNRYMVSFDATPTPIVLEVSSNLLRVEHMAAALPPDVPIPSIANVPEHLQENTQEMIHETVQDQEEEEHLPDSLPESEDMEEEENTAAAEEEAVLQDEVGKFCLNDFDFKNYEQDEVLSHLFLKLTFVNWRQKVELFNAAYKKSGTKGRLFTRQEFLVALGLLIAAAEFSHNGKDLFKRGDQKNRLQR
jgi:hypothetical protein